MLEKCTRVAPFVCQNQRKGHLFLRPFGLFCVARGIAIYFSRLDGGRDLRNEAKR